MKTINDIINEKLKLNSQSKLAIKKIDITKITNKQVFRCCTISFDNTAEMQSMEEDLKYYLICEKPEKSFNNTYKMNVYWSSDGKGSDNLFEFSLYYYNYDVNNTSLNYLVFINETQRTLFILFVNYDDLKEFYDNYIYKYKNEILKISQDILKSLK